VTYSGLFSTGDTTPAAGGVCDLACNPLEDNDFDGSGTDTKGSNTCGSAASVGCYGSPSYGTPPATGWSCTNDVNFTQSQPVGLRHRVIPLRREHDHAVFGQRLIDGADRTLAADEQRNDHERKDHDVAQRQHRQRFRDLDLFFGAFRRQLFFF
jgi:hypothetical protein